MRDTTISVLCVLLIGIGLLQIIGTFAQNAALVSFAHSLASSPRPIPLTGNSDFESFSSKATLIRIANSTNEMYDLQKDVFAKLKGPHKRKIVFLSAVELPRWDDTISRYAFCTNVIVGGAHQPSAIIMEIQSRKTEKKWTKTINC